MKILIVGAGNMGLTYAKSFLTTHVVTPENLFILEKSDAKAEELATQKLGKIYGEPSDFVRESDLIILAVKPQDTVDLFSKLKPFLDDQQLILSIMAGIRIDKISQSLGTKKVVRCMPNLPALVGEGMTVYTSANEVTRLELVMVQNLLNATGKAIYVEDEGMIDASTAISGSGPAYIFYFMQAMVEQGMQMGFSQAEAELLTFQTFKGAVELYNKFDFNCEEWISKVASKGGTTEAALKEFGISDANGGFKKGINAAFLRAQEFSTK